MAKKNSKNPVDSEFEEIKEIIENDAVPEFEKAVKEFTQTEVKDRNYELKESEINVSEKEENKDSFGLEQSTEDSVSLDLDSYGQKWIETECLYMVNSDGRPNDEFDYGDFLIDLGTILALEKIYPERLKDFGIDESQIHQDLLDSCIVHCSAFTEPIIIMDYTYDEMINLLTAYSNKK